MAEHKHEHERKTMWVVLLTAVTMVVEIVFGLITNSMALLADGIHMGSHVLAIGLSWIAYIIVRKVSGSKKFRGNPEKILSLSGFTSGLLLLIFAFAIIVEAVKRFYEPLDIIYREAIMVAVIGLVVNVVSALILHHKHEHSDHNIRAAYLHVIADALTSLTAIFGLTAAMIWDQAFIDPVAALVSSMVIIRWSIGLLGDSGEVLLDMKNSGSGHGHHH